MGELHLEIVEERLRRVYRVPCQLGQLQVAYREAPSLQSTASCEPLSAVSYLLPCNLQLLYAIVLYH